MFEDFLIDRFGQDSSDIIMRFVLPLLALIAMLIARRYVEPMLRYIFRVIDRAVKIVRLNQEMFTEPMILAFAPPLRFMILVVGVWVAILLYGVPGDWGQRANSIIETLIIVTIFWAVFRAIDDVFQILHQRALKAESTTKFNETMVHFGGRLASATILILAFVVIMQHWGYDLNGLLAGLGLGGLAVALAAQDALANLIGYFAIMLDGPFQVGDFVISEGFEGTIETIGFRTTRIRRPDRAVVLVPNRIMSNDIITNWSQSINGPRRGRARLNMTIGVTYSTSADNMLVIVDAIRTMLRQHEKVVKNSVIVHFVKFGESSLDIMVICVVRISDWEDMQATKEKINISIMRILDEKGAQIAFPTRTIVIDDPGTASVHTVE
jgi:MscS family membrane protein